MDLHWKLMIAFATLLSSLPSWAQSQCTDATRIEGAITDPSGAVIPGAQVQSSGGRKATSDALGGYVLACTPVGTITFTVQAEGFEAKSLSIQTHPRQTTHADVQLALAAVRTDVQVNAETDNLDDTRSGDTAVLDTKQVQQLADDPDDFLRQLQMLASAAGGDPTSAIITVDGFQNGSALPPKSSIASIRVSPDLFSSQYQFPPFSGGQIEITTKPGADSLHGTLFFTDSDGHFNATDPFSVTATPAGKRRYGFELSGPILAKKSGFVLALEKRDIDEFNVVNAVALDANNNPEPLQQTVSAAQRLWIGSARVDWQLTPNDVAALSWSSNVNNLGNQGIGGLVLPEAGYSSIASEHDLRFTNTFTLATNLLHETRIGSSWKDTADTPNSTTPALQVAGYFTSGGSTNQNLRDRERDLEIDDDLLATHGKHSLKLGAQSLAFFIHDYNPNTFNGAYVFGGGSAPVLDANNNPTSQTTTISAIEQYQRALLGFAGGTPTTYQVTTGTPLVPVTQWRLGLYLQDTIKLRPRLTLDAGLRYAFQTTPGSFLNFGPRLGIAWAADKKETWVFHARAGVFNNSSTQQIYAEEVYRLNGVRQSETTVYSPSYTTPLTPVPGSIAVSTIKQFPHSLGQQSTFVAYLNAEHDLPGHWHARANFYWGEDYHSVRIKNINAPFVAGGVGIAPNPTAALLAPRPIAPNGNILQYQNSGHLMGNVFSFSIDQHSYKTFGLYTRYAHQNFKSDVPNALIPQSSYSEQGESAKVDWNKLNAISFVGNVNLPYRIEWATQFDASEGLPFDVTTGTDNNGDGNFTDRPAYASTPGEGVYSTRFGLLTTNAVNGNVPRNLGAMPPLIHLDMNLSRAFVLKGDKDHSRTLTFNARSANVLNHTNATAVNTVLSSSALGQAISAETARRIELGVRFSF
jgi:Carboxypeptidase regulatory-like domain/TonB dependent receptor